MYLNLMFLSQLSCKDRNTHAHTDSVENSTVAFCKNTTVINHVEQNVTITSQVVEQSPNANEH